MTPSETRDRNPFVAIGLLVTALALIAGLGMRYGMNSYIAGLCVAAAVVGTWALLAPRVETLATVGTDLSTQSAPQATSPEAVSSVQAFVADTATPSRERLRGTPRTAVGFGATGKAQSGRADQDDRVRLPSSPPGSSDDEPPVKPLGQLPADAGSLTIASDVEPISNVSGAYTLGHFEVRATSRRGSDNIILDDPRQDDFVVVKAANGRYLIVVAADGFGSAENAHYGSYWAARLLAQVIDRHLREGVPGIENMLKAARDELVELFEMRFTDGTKMRTIATRLVGLIAPVDGGPAAGFRVGDSEILAHGPDGWRSVFAVPTDEEAQAVFPRNTVAQVAPLELSQTCLLIATEGTRRPLLEVDEVAAAFAEALAAPTTEVEFDQLMAFPLEEARGDRTAVAVWWAPR